MNCNRSKYDVHAVYADCSERKKAKEDMQQGFQRFVVPFCTYMVNNGITGTVPLYNGSNQTVIIFVCELNHCSVTHNEEEFMRKFLTCLFAIGYFVHE
mgnify:CR=1 FL=1